MRTTETKGITSSGYSAFHEGGIRGTFDVGTYVAINKSALDERVTCGTTIDNHAGGTRSQVKPIHYAVGEGVVSTSDNESIHPPTRSVSIPPGEHTFEGIIVRFHPHPVDNHASRESTPVCGQGHLSIYPCIIAAIQNEGLIHHDILFIGPGTDDDGIAIRCSINGILNRCKIVIVPRSDRPCIRPHQRGGPHGLTGEDAFPGRYFTVKRKVTE